MNLSNGICIICENDRETLEHLFFHCNKIKPVLGSIEKILLNIMTISKTQSIPLAVQHLIFGYDTEIKSFNLLNTIIFETKWQVWKLRNSHKHDSNQPNIVFCCCCCFCGGGEEAACGDKRSNQASK